MFEKTLFKNTKTVLALLGKSGVLNNAYLAGGTGLALQLGHRISIDLDFFTPYEFDIDELLSNLMEISHFELDEKKRGTIVGRFGETKFSLFVYKYPIVFSLKKFLDIKILDAREIGAMKLEAIATRGKKRDFIDLYFILQKLISLKEILSLYEKKYGHFGNKMIHILKSFTYFEDAERDEMPRMLVPADWEEIKNFFEKETKKITKELLRGG